MKLVTLGANQTAIWFNNGMEIFFSYNTPVAAFVPEIGYLRTEKKHSVTTSKHINKWIAGYNAEMRPQVYFDNLMSEKEENI